MSHKQNDRYHEQRREAEGEVMTVRAQFKAFEFLQVKGMRHEDLELYASAPELLEALKKAQSYILRLKGKEFNVRNADYFSISTTMSCAIAKAEGRA